MKSDGDMGGWRWRTDAELEADYDHSRGHYGAMEQAKEANRLRGENARLRESLRILHALEVQRVDRADPELHKALGSAYALVYAERGTV